MCAREGLSRRKNIRDDRGERSLLVLLLLSSSRTTLTGNESKLIRDSTEAW
jgi:hypothetical protein